MTDYFFVAIASLITLVVFLFGLGYLINEQNHLVQMRYEQCLTAGMQWNGGDCFK